MVTRRSEVRRAGGAEHAEAPWAARVHRFAPYLILRLLSFLPSVCHLRTSVTSSLLAPALASPTIRPPLTSAALLQLRVIRRHRREGALRTWSQDAAAHVRHRQWYRLHQDGLCWQCRAQVNGGVCVVAGRCSCFRYCTDTRHFCVLLCVSLMSSELDFSMFCTIRVVFPLAGFARVGLLDRCYRANRSAADCTPTFYVVQPHCTDGNRGGR